MSADRQDDLRVAERAAHWHERLDSADARQREQFMRWLEESPRHVREFLMLQSIDLEARHLDPHRRIDVTALLAGTPRNVEPLFPAVANEGAAVPPRTRRLARLGAAAAVVCIALGVWLHATGKFPGAGRRYATETGQQSSLRLDDGSRVELNTQSQLRVSFDSESRDVRLLSGEALFEVALDRQRPFHVRTRDARIQALGTRFNVREREDGTTVAVLDGRVAVVDAGGARTELGAGAAVSVSPERMTPPRAVSASEVTAWQRRELIFREETLENIAAEFNRYNATTRIVVQSDAARTRHYGGIFHAEDPDSLIAFLRADAALRIEREGAGWVIR